MLTSPQKICCVSLFFKLLALRHLSPSLGYLASKSCSNLSTKSTMQHHSKVKSCSRPALKSVSRCGWIIYRTYRINQQKLEEGTLNIQENPWCDDVSKTKRNLKNLVGFILVGFILAIARGFSWLNFKTPSVLHWLLALLQEQQSHQGKPTKLVGMNGCLSKPSVIDNTPSPKLIWNLKIPFFWKGPPFWGSMLVFRGAL